MKKIYTDGFTIGKNPSNTGGGFVLIVEENAKIYVERIFKTNFTNNEAELCGLNKASQFASEGDWILSDSFTAIAWVHRGNCKARPDLCQMAKDAKDNCEYKNLILKHIPRELNIAGNYIDSTLKG